MTSAAPIGRPITAAHVSILDPNGLNILPPQQVGEIVVSGVPVAHGYWSANDVTASHSPLERPTADARFITLQDGSSAYRTGEQACVSCACTCCH